MNEYAWTTAPVLRELSSVRPGDLGAVVNLGGAGDSRHEWALPVALFDDKFDGRVKTYRFTLKTDGRAEVLARIYVGSRQLFERPKIWEATGSPFTVQWTTAASAAEGWYRLVLSGQFDDGSPVDKEVTFYHKPALAPGGSRVP